MSLQDGSSLLLSLLGSWASEPPSGNLQMHTARTVALMSWVLSSAAVLELGSCVNSDKCIESLSLKLFRFGWLRLRW